MPPVTAVGPGGSCMGRALTGPAGDVRPRGRRRRRRPRAAPRGGAAAGPRGPAGARPRCRTGSPTPSPRRGRTRDGPGPAGVGAGDRDGGVARCTSGSVCAHRGTMMRSSSSTPSSASVGSTGACGTPAAPSRSMRWTTSSWACRRAHDAATFSAVGLMCQAGASGGVVRRAATSSVRPGRRTSRAGSRRPAASASPRAAGVRWCRPGGSRWPSGGRCRGARSGRGHATRGSTATPASRPPVAGPSPDGEFLGEDPEPLAFIGDGVDAPLGAALRRRARSRRHGARPSVARSEHGPSGSEGCGVVGVRVVAGAGRGRCSRSVSGGALSWWPASRSSAVGGRRRCRRAAGGW